jgi:hypothetical protein
MACAAMKLMAGVAPGRVLPRRNGTLPSGFVTSQLTPVLPRRKQPETANPITHVDHGPSIGVRDRGQADPGG